MPYGHRSTFRFYILIFSDSHLGIGLPFLKCFVQKCLFRGNVVKLTRFAGRSLKEFKSQKQKGFENLSQRISNLACSLKVVNL